MAEAAEASAAAGTTGDDKAVSKCDEAHLVWFFLIAGLFSETQDYGIADEVLPDEDFFRPILDIMVDTGGMRGT